MRRIDKQFTENNGPTCISNLLYISTSENDNIRLDLSLYGEDLQTYSCFQLTVAQETWLLKMLLARYRERKADLEARKEALLKLSGAVPKESFDKEHWNVGEN